MHEFTLIQNICNAIDKIAHENNLRKITRVNLKVGKMRQVIPEFMQFAFSTIAKDKIYENAELVIEIIAIKILCHNCKKEFEVEENIYLCPFCACNSSESSESSNVYITEDVISTSSIEVLSGKEFILESIEGE